MLVVYEAAGLTSDFASYLVRSLLSEGRLSYETVEKTAEGMKARRIEREGPTGLIVTTTAVSLHPENETRLLSVTVTDTPMQTRAVLAALAAKPACGLNFEPWHALQRWLAGAARQVEIPYAPALVDLIPPLAVRLRRDVGTLLNLIRAHALLHVATRPRGSESCVLATLDDYAVVRELIADLVAEGIGATVSNTVRETVAAVRKHAEGHAEVTVAAVAEELKLDRSAALRRVRAATERGYLKNLETGRGRPARLVLGDRLPEEVVVLPTLADLEDCRGAARMEGVEGKTFGVSPRPAEFERGDAWEPEGT
jgi:hypothetical protein